MLLVIGASSTTAKYIKSFFRKDILLFSDKKKGSDYFIDLKNIKLIDFDRRITHAVFLAGITNIEFCNKYPDIAKEINCINTIKLIIKLNNIGIKVLFPSSTCVFSSKSNKDNFETSSINPDTIYGRLKGEVENIILQNKLNTVLRISKIIAPDNKLLVNWKKELLNNKNIQAFDDLKLAPLSVFTLIKYLYDWYKSNYSGILHLSPSSDINYFELAHKMADYLYIDNDLVKPISITESNKEIIYQPYKSYIRCKFRESKELDINKELNNIFKSLN